MKKLRLHTTEVVWSVKKHYLIHEMKRGVKNTGVKKIRIHDLRHSHVALLINMEFPILAISERLGHENIQTTLQTYGHLYPNKQKEIAEELNKLNGEK